MPYTPPAQRSPVASQSSTPRKLSSATLASTENQASKIPSHEARPNPPQSANSKSYLHMHRRSPSISKPTASFAEPSTSEARVERERYEGEKGKDIPTADQTPQVNGTADPDSFASSTLSSDDESHDGRGRCRDMTDYAELQAAIRSLEQHWESSPTGKEDRRRVSMHLEIPKSRLDPNENVNGFESEPSPKLPLSASARKISHSRSSTDASAFFEFPKHKIDTPARAGSEEDSDGDDLQIKPSLIRKKSGELVRPALRASSTRRRPSSVPGTPTYSKAVHFQENSLEDVRHFLQVDRPIAVSASSSPVNSYDEDAEFPFGDPDDSPTGPSYEWDIRLTNFPRDNIERRSWPVRTERIYLSPDNKTLMGNVAVRNLSFHKHVVARFTLDYWKTTSETVAEYNNDVRRKEANDGCDRFTFSIKLEDQANLENKTMFFCIRYNVGGKQYWDNNDSLNYQIDFSKNFKNQNGKQRPQPAASRSLNALPRSQPSQPRPRSMPSIDDFGSHMSPFDFSSFPQPNAMVGDSPIRFRSRPSKQNTPDVSAKPKAAAANQQAFGNRYDFGASLSAAIQAAGTSTPKSSTPPGETAPVLKDQPAPGAGQNASSNLHAGRPETSTPATNGAKPAALTAEKPALQSSSYHELLDRYCFFGSGKPSSRLPRVNPDAKAATLPVQIDGAGDTVSPPSETGAVGSQVPVVLSPARSISPTEERKPVLAAVAAFSGTKASRSGSPSAKSSARTSRSHSPAFGYTYHYKNPFESHTPTAIRG